MGKIKKKRKNTDAEDAEDTEDTGKRKTNKPLVTLQLEEYAKEHGLSKNKRIKTVKCGLKRAVYNKSIRNVLDSLCTRIGLQRHIVSLFTNYLFLTRISKNQDLPEVNKQLYDRSWSAMVAYIDGKNTKADMYTEEFKQFAKDTNLDVKTLTESTKYEIRQPITRDMATAAKEHIISNFYKRLYQYTAQAQNIKLPVINHLWII